MKFLKKIWKFHDMSKSPVSSNEIGDSPMQTAFWSIRLDALEHV
jgi:hypothetical protein